MFIYIKKKHWTIFCFVFNVLLQSPLDFVFFFPCADKQVSGMVSSDFSLTAVIQPIMTICMLRVMTLFTTL